MRKQEFLAELKDQLSGLPKQDVDERLRFYGEMIDDRMEEGISEEDAVLALGSVHTLARQIIADIPLAKIAKERIKPQKRLKAWEIALLAIGSPIWLSLAVSAIAVVVSVYVSLWSVIISLWSVFVSLACCGPCGVLAGIFFAVNGSGGAGLITVGGGLVCAGLAIFSFFGCKAATKGILVLTKKLAVGIKKGFVKKEMTK